MKKTHKKRLEASRESRFQKKNLSKSINRFLNTYIQIQNSFKSEYICSWSFVVWSLKHGNWMMPTEKSVSYSLKQQVKTVSKFVLADQNAAEKFKAHFLSLSLSTCLLYLSSIKGNWSGMRVLFCLLLSSLSVAIGSSKFDSLHLRIEFFSQF